MKSPNVWQWAILAFIVACGVTSIVLTVLVINAALAYAGTTP